MFFFQAEDGIRDLVRSRGLGDVYKRQDLDKKIGEKFIQSKEWVSFAVKNFDKETRSLALKTEILPSVSGTLILLSLIHISEPTRPY